MSFSLYWLHKAPQQTTKGVCECEYLCVHVCVTWNIGVYDNSV